jgi:hypothetical protein
MAYIDVISLATAKNHLRVDSTLTADDTAITRMITSALRYVERETNILVYQRDKTYLMEDGCIYVYDYPINDVVTPADYDDDDTVQKQNYSIYNYGSDTIDFTLDVGYVDPADVPEDLIEVALEIIDLMYYSHETGKTVNKDLSALSRDTLNTYKRFLI